MENSNAKRHLLLTLGEQGPCARVLDAPPHELAALAELAQILELAADEWLSSRDEAA